MTSSVDCFAALLDGAYSKSATSSAEDFHLLGEATPAAAALLQRALGALSARGSALALKPQA